MNDKEKLKNGIKESLKNGNYEELFFEDLFNLWQIEGISPEVVLRELRALEGTEEPLLIMDTNEPIPVWFGGSDSMGPDMFLKLGPSATKDATEFTRKDSPLKGLWHKHYYIHQDDFFNENAKNVARRRPFLKNAPPIMQMMARITEGALTGEWIIFRKDGAINTYLCLAKHNDGDEKIHKKLESGRRKYGIKKG